MKEKIVIAAVYKMVETYENLNFYKRGFQCKTYLDKASQMCIISTSNVVERQEDFQERTTGLITVSSSGCAVSSKKYLGQLKNLEQFKFASPLLFTHSLCNMPHALTTIEFNLKGAGNHFVGKEDSTLIAYWQAKKFIEECGQKQVVVTSYECVDREGGNYKLDRKKEQYCEKGEAAGSVLITTEGYASYRGLKGLFEILKVKIGELHELTKDIADSDFILSSEKRVADKTGANLNVTDRTLHSVKPVIQLKYLQDRTKADLTTGSTAVLLEQTDYGKIIMCKLKVLS